MNETLTDLVSQPEASSVMLSELMKKRSITCSDVAALRNSEMSMGVLSRQQAEQIFAIERGPARKCRAWGNFLVETLLDFVVWGERPTGKLSPDDACWILDQAGEAPTPASLAFLVAVLEEAGSLPDWYEPAVRARARRVFVAAPLAQAA